MEHPLPSLFAGSELHSNDHPISCPRQQQRPVAHCNTPVHCVWPLYLGQTEVSLIRGQQLEKR